MGANDVEGRGQPIPELPEELVFAHVVPRLPWYTRPVCRTLSKSWRALIDTRNPELDLRTRTIQLPLLRDAFLLCTFDKQIFISDPEMKGACRMNGYQVQPHWRKLPPFESLAAPKPFTTSIAASSGMVYVWPDYEFCDFVNEEGQSFVLKLDIGCADCTWKKCSVPDDFNAIMVAFNGSIYVLPGTTDFEPSNKAVLVHDMSTDTCKQVEKWVPDNLRVLSRSTHLGGLVEEMYGVVEEAFPKKLEIVMYDVVLDSWRTWYEVPLPEFGWLYPHQVLLLNAECFEPVPETGANFIWINEGDVFFWFNSSVGSWVNIDLEVCLESFHLIHGSMYAVILEQKENLEDGKKEEEDREGLADLLKWVLMKGRIIVASNSVAWEEVQEIGFFDERCGVDTLDGQPMEWLTVMA